MNPGSVPSDVAAVRGPGIYKHGSVTVCIVPLAAVLNPAAAQVSIHSKAVPGTVYLNPAAYRITSVFKLEPFSTLVDAPVVALSGGEILSTVRWHPRAAGAGRVPAGVSGTSGNILSISRAAGIAVVVVIADIVCFFRSQKHGIRAYPLSLF